MDRLKQLWAGLPPTNRMMLALSGAAVVALTIGFLVWAGSEDYVTLIRDPASADLPAIQSYLKDQKVAYRVSDDGKSIEVPASKQAELQMGLAGANLLNGSSSLGYRLLDKTNPMMTDRMEDLTIRRALEGHVEQAIESLDPVQSATIQYVPGTDSPFVSDKRSASAMVVVHTKPGRELDDSNVKAIVNLTARAFDGLDTKNVSLADGDGNLLWDGTQSASGVGDMSERFSLERQYQDRLSRDIKRHIEQVAGPGKCSVVVRTTLDLDSETETTHQVLEGVKTSTSETTEKLTGGGKLNGARPAAGVAANTGVATPPTYRSGSDVSTPQGQYTSDSVQETYAPSTKETVTARAPGEVQSISVAVLLDSSVAPDAVAAIKRDVDALVPPANPADPAFSRQVSVEQVPFDRVAAEARKRDDQTAASAERLNRWLNYGVPIALMLLMLFVLARSLRRAPRPLTLALPGQLALAGANAGAGLGSVAQPGLNLVVDDGGATGQFGPTTVASALGEAEQEEDFADLDFPKDNDVTSITRLAKARPEMVATLLRGWMNEDT